MSTSAASSEIATDAALHAQHDARRVIIATLAPTFALAFLQFLMPVLAVDLMAALGSPAEGYGIVAAAMALGCIALYLGNAAVLPAFGPVAMTQLALALNIIGIALMLVGRWPPVLLGAFVIGVGFAAITPAASQLISEFVPRTRWATAFSLRVTAIPVGGIAAGILGTLLVSAGGWRAGLALASLLCGLSGLIVLRMPRRLNGVRPPQRLRVGHIFRRETVLQPFQLMRESWPLRQIILAGSCLSILHGVLTGFLVAYLTTVHRLTLEQAGLLFAIVQGMGIVGRFGLGPLADRLGSSMPILVVLAPTGFAAMLLLAVFDPGWPFAVQAAIAAFAGLGASTFTGLYIAEVARRAPQGGVGLATTASGLVSFSTYAVTPIAFAGLAQSLGWPMAFALMGMAGAAALFLLAMPLGRFEPFADAQKPVAERVNGVAGAPDFVPQGMPSVARPIAERSRIRQPRLLQGVQLGSRRNGQVSVLVDTAPTVTARVIKFQSNRGGR